MIGCCMVPRRPPRLLPKSQAIPLLSSDPPNLLRSAAYKVPYILPSYGYSNSFLFTLFTKLPGYMDGIPHFPFSLFHFRPRLSSLECAVLRFRALTPLECALTKTHLRKSFRMRSYKKTGGRGACPNVQLSNAVYASRTFRRDLHMCNVSRFPCTTCT